MKPVNLSDQIKRTKHQLAGRQQAIHDLGDNLVKDVKQKATAPTTLLLAGMFGFIVGELTLPPKRKHGNVKQAVHSTLAGTMPRAEFGAGSGDDFPHLKKALNFVSLAQTLYQALPWVFLIDTFYPIDKQPQPVDTDKTKSV